MEDIEKKINRRIGQLVKEGDREIAKLNADVIKEVRKLLSWYYEKYEVGGKLTYEEMAKYKRLKRLERDLMDVLRHSYGGLDKMMHRVLRDVYQEGYYMTAWGIENEIGKDLRYTTLSDEIIASVNNPISGLTLSDRLEKNRTAILWSIRENVTQGLVQGETYGTMAKRLVKVLDGDKAKAMRIVRTEAHRISEEGKFHSAQYAEENGIIIKKEWLCSMDERARSTHKDLDGKKIPLEDEFKTPNGTALYPGGFGVAREDINCRCTLLKTVEGIDGDLEDKEKQSYKQFRGGLK